MKKIKINSKMTSIRTSVWTRLNKLLKFLYNKIINIFKKMLILILIWFLLYWFLYAEQCPPDNYWSKWYFYKDLSDIMNKCKSKGYKNCRWKRTGNSIRGGNYYRVYKWECNKELLIPVPSTFSTENIVIMESSIKMTGKETTYPDLIEISDFLKIWTFDIQ